MNLLSRNITEFRFEHSLGIAGVSLTYRCTGYLSIGYSDFFGEHDIVTMSVDSERKLVQFCRNGKFVDSRSFEGHIRPLTVVVSILEDSISII